MFARTLGTAAWPGFLWCAALGRISAVAGEGDELDGRTRLIRAHVSCSRQGALLLDAATERIAIEARHCVDVFDPDYDVVNLADVKLHGRRLFNWFGAVMKSVGDRRKRRARQGK